MKGEKNVMKVLLQFILAVFCDGVTVVALLRFYYAVFSRVLACPGFAIDCVVIFAAFATVLGGYYFWPSVGYENE